MVYQLGPPALFLTLNPPRPVEWPDFFRCVNMTRDGVRAASSTELANIVTEHPVEWVLYFEYRLNGVVEWLTGPDAPFGQITDTVVVIEEQARGFLHAHTLLWVRAPDVVTELGRAQFPRWYAGEEQISGERWDGAILNVTTVLPLAFDRASMNGASQVFFNVVLMEPP